MAGILVVTGASRGIGAATARLAAGRGWAVAVNYHASAVRAEAVVADIEAAGGRAVAIGADVATEEGAVRLFSEVDRQLGAPTALFNNAGILHKAKTIEDFSLADLDTVWRVNISGQFLCAREAVKRMSTRHGGRGGAIVNVSSAQARLGGGNSALAYAASKGAIDTFTHGLARELAPHGIRVNAVRPGLIDTEIHASTGEQGRIQTLLHTVPLGRSGRAEEVAEAVLWLISPQASYVVGSIVDVGGGR